MKFLPIISAACLFGCAAVPPSHYYQLHYASSPLTVQDPYPYSVLFKMQSAPEAYSRSNIVYRTSDYEIAFYDNLFWADKPARLVGDLLLEDFEKRGMFKSFAKTVGDVAPDFELSCEIVAIEEVKIDSGKASFARAYLIYTLKKFDSQNVLWSRRYDFRDSVSGKGAEAFVKKESELLTRMNKEAALSLDSLFTKLPPIAGSLEGIKSPLAAPADTVIAPPEDNEE